MALHKINALHQQPGFPRHGAQNRARLALVAAGRDDDLVAFPDLHRHHSTSGAREMIFMNCLARSSRVTGPKMRVPIGSPWLLINTAALRSKRIAVPSGRRTSLAVRQMTARCRSPFLPDRKGDG